MALVLNIDTATETGSINVAEDGRSLGTLINKDQRDHASWIHSAIDRLLHDNGCSLADLAAVAVTAGPGSYTGLRVGMATAKGLCYSLGIPLITESTLKMMAFAANSVYANLLASRLCPMIDARRMEVFTAIYDDQLSELMAPAPVILGRSSFQELLHKDSILFFGNGAAKFQQICDAENAFFKDIAYSAEHLALLAFEKLTKSNFADLAYAEPVYLK